MAFHNGAGYLRDAAQSVLRQRDANVELLLCDDASTDAAPKIAQALVEEDPRVRLLRNSAQAGPGAARNLGIDAARGEWIGIVDADDLIHPNRTERLLRVAGQMNADVVADDLVRFGAEGGTTLLQPLSLTGTWRPGAQDLLRAERGKKPTPVGYLKPLFRRSVLGQMRYRTDLPIGEDYDLLLRLALKGANFRVVPEPWYLYRRHAASTSHRMTPAQCTAIIASIQDLAAMHPDWALDAKSDLLGWRRELERQRTFAEFVDTLKHRRIATATRQMIQAPHLAAGLLRAARQGISRRFRPAPPDRDPRRLVLSANQDVSRGVPFLVPASETDWDGLRAAALAKVTGSGARHLHAIGRPGLIALDHVPGWRLAELSAPPDGWSATELSRIAALPWPVLHVSEPETTSTASPDMATPPEPVYRT